jgi:dGTPase
MIALRGFMYRNVYRSQRVHGEFVKAKKILTELYGFYLDHPDALKNDLARKELNAGDWEALPRERVVCDLIASMTDRYALDRYAKLFFPSPQV